MIGISIKEVKRPWDAKSINKQINFGTAVGITKTLKAAQRAVPAEVQKDFTYRNRWLGPSNPFGIQITTASKEDNPPTGSIQTRAGWLAKQKIGGEIEAGQRKRVFPYTFEGKEYIAIPSNELRPHGSAKVLAQRYWPSNLKNAFVIKAKDGTLLLAVRFSVGRDYNDIAIMYVLVPRVDLHAKDAWTPAIEKVVREQLTTNIGNAIETALRTAK
jgi:hypothetical protein